MAAGRPLEKVRIAVLRGPPTRREVLLLLHPQTAPQLPGGGVEPGESLLAAARRELEEETGLAIGAPGRFAAPFEMRVAGGPYGDGPLETQRWHVWIVDAPGGVAEVWEHRVGGSGVDGGHRYRYVWAPLAPALADRVHERFRPVVERLLGAAP